MRFGGWRIEMWNIWGHFGTIGGKLRQGRVGGEVKWELSHGVARCRIWREVVAAGRVMGGCGLGWGHGVSSLEGEEMRAG